MTMILVTDDGRVRGFRLRRPLVFDTLTIIMKDGCSMKETSLDIFDAQKVCSVTQLS